MLAIASGRRTQVVKGEVCKTSMQRFESARRLQPSLVVQPLLYLSLKPSASRFQGKDLDTVPREVQESDKRENLSRCWREQFRRCRDLS